MDRGLSTQTAPNPADNVSGYHTTRTVRTPTRYLFVCVGYICIYRRTDTDKEIGKNDNRRGERKKKPNITSQPLNACVRRYILKKKKNVRNKILSPF